MAPESAGYRLPNSRILLFAKAPIPGQVKTRMQPQLSPRQSADLHLQLLEHMLASLRRWAVAPITLVIAGEHPCWQVLESQFGVELQQQVSGDLGNRMAHAAKEALQHSEQVVLLGSDCPFITRAYLQSAFRFLQQGVDVVFGPADDGGYVLLGLSDMRPSLFEDIDWGTENVLMQSCRKLQGGYVCLPSLKDIDRPEDILSLEAVPAFKRWLCCAR